MFIFLGGTLHQDICDTTRAPLASPAGPGEKS